MELHEPKPRTVALSFAGVFAAGTVGYMLIEGWNAFDSFYMTTITVATIGYGEVHPLSTAGRAFTIVLSLVGLGVVAYAFSTVTAFVVEGRFSHALRRRKMESRINALRDHYIVCGAGHTGHAVIEELFRTGRPFVVVDKEGSLCDAFERKGALVVRGNAMEDETLKRAGIERAKGLCCALDNDPDNVFLTLSARTLNANLRIVSEVHDDFVRERIIRSGADAAVSSQSIGGLRMASEMIRPAAVGFLDSMIRDPHSTYRFEEVVVGDGSGCVGRSVASLRAPGKNDPVMLAIKDPRTQRYAINPPDDTLIRAGDVLVVMGDRDGVKRLKESAAK